MKQISIEIENSEALKYMMHEIEVLKKTNEDLQDKVKNLDKRENEHRMGTFRGHKQFGESDGTDEFDVRLKSLELSMEGLAESIQKLAHVEENQLKTIITKVHEMIPMIKEISEGTKPRIQKLEDEMKDTVRFSQEARQEFRNGLEEWVKKYEKKP